MIATAHFRTEKWRNVVGEKAMQAVAEAVSPVIGATFSPGPPITGMDKIVAAALDALGVARTGIITVSASAPGPFLASLSEATQRFFAIRPKDVVARAIAWRMRTPFDETLDASLRTPLADALGAENAARLRARMWLELVRLPSKDGRNRHGELGDMILQARWAAATYNAGFAGAGIAERLPPLRAILELIRLGNIPLGTFETDEFMVLVG